MYVGSSAASDKIQVALCTKSYKTKITNVEWLFKLKKKKKISEKSILFILVAVHRTATLESNCWQYC